MTCGEFELINRFFNRSATKRRDVETGIGDDCALLKVNGCHIIAISTDTLVEGTHFLEDIDPSDLGYKALAVNLSDLAAMGADPAWLTLALTLPDVNESWLQAFSDSLFEQLSYYDMQLIGGDTTRGPLAMTLSVHGLIPEGKAIKRSGAKMGDWIYVTGSLGDSAAGLAVLQQHLSIDDKNTRQYLLNRHLRPTPRILQGQALRHLASAAIDISDGLMADLSHLLQASHAGARLHLEKIPLSSQLQAVATCDQAMQWALSGGEDYELCFTVPELNRGALAVALDHLGVPYTCIGQICTQQEGLSLLQDGKVTGRPASGFDHFVTHCNH